MRRAFKDCICNHRYYVIVRVRLKKRLTIFRKYFILDIMSFLKFNEISTFRKMTSFKINDILFYRKILITSEKNDVISSFIQTLLICICMLTYAYARARFAFEIHR